MPVFLLAAPMPYPFEVAAWEQVYACHDHVQELEEQLAMVTEDMERFRRFLGGKLPTDGTYDVSFVDGGELVRQVNEGLSTVALDIHRRSQIDEPRKLTVTVKAEPSENSAAVKWDYEVKVSLAKSGGGGVAYLDKAGKLQAPEQVDLEQVMLPMPGKPKLVKGGKQEKEAA